MYFSEIIGQIGKGNYIFDKNNQVILEIVEGKIKIQFYPENAKVICNSEEVEVSLEQFSDFTFEERESEVDGEENQVALLFNNDEILVCTESKSSTIQALFESFSNFTNIARGNYFNDIQGISENKMLVYALNKNINLYTLDFNNNKVSTSSLDTSQSSLGIIYGVYMLFHSLNLCIWYKNLLHFIHTKPAG